MPFPFRNPVNPSYDDSEEPPDSGGDSKQQTDPKLEAIVQKMIDAGEPEENIATVIKGYKAQPAATPKPNTPAATPEKPDDAWWRGFNESLTGPDAEALHVGLRGAANIPIGLAEAPFGALSSIGKLMTSPMQAADDVLNMPHNIATTVSHAGSDPESFGNLVGQAAFMPIAGKVSMSPEEAGPGVASAGRGLQNVGEFVAKHQPLTGIAPPFAMPRTLRLVEKGMGKATDYIGKGVEKIGDKMAGKDVPDLPDVDEGVDLSTPLGVKVGGEAPSDIISKPGATPINLNNINQRLNELRDKSRNGTLTGAELDEAQKLTKLQRNVMNIQGATPPEKVATLQKTATNIQDNIDKKYGAGNTDKASPSTQKKLADTKAATPVLNRPGTYITVKSPTPQQIVQAQQLGYQIESKDSLGNVRMKQTGKPIIINQPPRNTDLTNIDLNAPIMGGGGQ